jgi:hypothetical protein
MTSVRDLPPLPLQTGRSVLWILSSRPGPGSPVAKQPGPQPALLEFYEQPMLLPQLWHR